ncbi:hypothetical protein [Chryseobacterium oleae]|uniref:hypothetical protein n=1 Tax=Chryseobacterium oleae TaxID=491207 RepID=UPI00142E4371|nr:hypothetical protein [Chryseobacterium oleae]
MRKLRVLEISKDEISAKLVDPVQFIFSNAKKNNYIIYKGSKDGINFIDSDEGDGMR